MESKQIFLFVFLVLAVFSMSRIRFLEESLRYGDELEMYAGIVNSGNRDIDDVRVIAYMPELGEDIRGSSFDINDNDNYGKLMWWNIPNSIPKGEYMVRITASNDDHMVRKFRYITVE